MSEAPSGERPAEVRIAVVCLGNICRSPIAEIVLRDRLAAAGLDDRVGVESFGTGGWHRGEPMDRRAAATLTQAGYDPSGHRARRLEASQAAEFDLILAMDADNLRDLRWAAGPGTTVRLFRDFDVLGPGADVPDPYYGGPEGFEEVLRMVERTATEIVARVAAGRLS